MINPQPKLIFIADSQRGQYWILISVVSKGKHIYLFPHLVLWLGLSTVPLWWTQQQKYTHPKLKIKETQVTLMLLHRTGASWCRAAPLWLCKHLWILTVMDNISPTMTRKTGSQACELEPATCHMGRIHKALWVQIALGPGGFPGSCSRVSISHSLESEHSQPTKPPWGCPSFSCWSLWPFAVMRVSIISEESNPALGEYPSLNLGKPVWVCWALEWTKVHTFSLA